MSSLASMPTMISSPSSFHVSSSWLKSSMKACRGSRSVNTLRKCRMCCSWTVPPVAGLSSLCLCGMGQYALTMRTVFPCFPWILIHVHRASLVASVPFSMIFCWMFGMAISPVPPNCIGLWAVVGSAWLAVKIGVCVGSLFLLRSLH